MLKQFSGSFWNNDREAWPFGGLLEFGSRGRHSFRIKRAKPRDVLAAPDSRSSGHGHASRSATRSAPGGDTAVGATAPGGEQVLATGSSINQLSKGMYLACAGLAQWAKIHFLGLQESIRTVRSSFA